MRRLFRLGLCLLLATAPARAANLPPGFTESQFGGVWANIANGTAMAFAPDGRLFVGQQSGALRVIRNGLLLTTPFVTIPVDSTGERGLLGVAFDPDFASNHYVYVYYTTPSAPIHNRVSRFTANGDVAVAGSETVILDLDNVTATNHNGGALHFGPDGKLYIATGENAVPSNAQSLGNLLGKVLRINRDGTIPPDNPFFNQATGNNRAIWTLGLRNPFTFAFDRANGRVFINDVGQGTWEEINEGVAGRNYGWPSCEGNCTTPPPTPPSPFTNPVHQYLNDASACAIVGATFYNPPVRTFHPDYVGKYFFADLCANWIRYLDPNIPFVAEFATGLSSPVDLQVGPDGALYYLQRGNGGQVWRVALGSYAMIQGRNDFDGDGRTDFAIWRPVDGNWYVIRSATGQVTVQQWGLPGDVPAPGDYDGDGHTDFAVWRPATGVWHVIPSGSGQTVAQQWGLPGDVPVPGDYDGDGQTDFAVWRPAEGNWYVIHSSTDQTSVQQWGLPGDMPVPADYDADGRTDFAIWRPVDGRWYVIASATGTMMVQQWGLRGDVPAPGDYDADGRTDFAVWRPADGTWYVIRSASGQVTVQQWGLPGDAPVPGDYDADRGTDFAVWRPGSGTWFVIPSASGTASIRQWGLLGDVAVPSH
ncbi:MAG: PQQ-dependent sugar dehydrogenase [Betaproteobacteria bacterium]|nr:PQQ-dependent sugar dehydrogenase [Betaproteobacteria bacterium]